jgi:hypothetical protein
MPAARPVDARAPHEATATAGQGSRRRGAAAALGAARRLAGGAAHPSPAARSPRSRGGDQHGGQDVPVQRRHAGDRGWGAVWHGGIGAGDVHHRGAAEQEPAHVLVRDRGAGKGYSLRVLLSREHFANGLRVYGIDQDEQGEYAGRFCAYLGGDTVPIRTVADAQRFAELWAETPHGRGQWSADVLIWDLHESDERDRSEIFAILKVALVAHLLAYPGRAAFIVDEAVTVTEDELGARTLGDLARRGRHFGLEVHVLT